MAQAGSGASAVPEVAVSILLLGEKFLQTFVSRKTTHSFYSASSDRDEKLSYDLRNGIEMYPNSIQRVFMGNGEKTRRETS